MATVEEARRTNDGPFRAIAPIFQIALEPQAGQALNLEQATQVLQPILGKNFTLEVFHSFIPQLVKLGWLIEVPTGRNEAAYSVALAFSSFNEREAEKNSLKKLDVLYSLFCSFLREYAPLLNFSITDSEFKWKLFQWAVSLDGIDKSAISDQAKRILSGKKPGIKSLSLDETHQYSKVDRALSVEFAAFVRWLAQQNCRELADIAALSELGLAIEFLEELRSPKANQSK